MNFKETTIKLERHFNSTKVTDILEVNTIIIILIMLGTISFLIGVNDKFKLLDLLLILLSCLHFNKLFSKVKQISVLKSRLAISFKGLT